MNIAPDAKIENHDGGKDRRWRFSLQKMFVIVTHLCILFALSKNFGAVGFVVWFTLFVHAMIMNAWFDFKPLLSIFALEKRPTAQEIVALGALVIMLWGLTLPAVSTSHRTIRKPPPIATAPAPSQANTSSIENESVE